MNSQDYIEISIKVTPFCEENTEILIAWLSDLPYDMFCIENDIVKAYIQREEFNAAKLKVVLSGLEFGTSYKTTMIPPANWNAEWEKDFTPIIVEDTVTIKSSSHKNLRRTRFNITLSPNMAFGTGHHLTTAMMIESMLKYEHEIKNKVVSDMGCGTGILAILAAKMNAARIYAIDIDAVASKSAFENARKNKVGKIVECYCGDASLLQMNKYDVIFANIHKNILLSDMKTYSMSLKENGLLFISGFYDKDRTEIENEAANHRMKVISSMEKSEDFSHENKKWCCLTLQKQKK